MPKPTLEEMAELCQERADSLRYHLVQRFYPENPGKKHPRWEHEVEVWEAAAITFRTVGTYEDDFRKFVSDHLKRYRDGR